MLGVLGVLFVLFPFGLGVSKTVAVTSGTTTLATSACVATIPWPFTGAVVLWAKDAVPATATTRPNVKVRIMVTLQI